MNNLTHMYFCCLGYEYVLTENIKKWSKLETNRTFADQGY